MATTSNAAAGFVLKQDAFRQGTFLAPVQAIITAADPVISIALGAVWLDAFPDRKPEAANETCSACAKRAAGKGGNRVGPFHRG